MVSAGACSRRASTLGRCKGQLASEATAASARLLFPTGVLLPDACAVLPELCLPFMLLSRHTAFLHFPLGSFEESVPGGRHLSHPRGSSANAGAETSLAEDHT